MTDETVAYMGWGISAQEQIDGFRKEVRELKAENTKLRELVRKLVGLDSLYEVPAYNVNEWSRRMDSIHDEMRELGVEMDDA